MSAKLNFIHHRQVIRGINSNWKGFQYRINMVRNDDGNLKGWIRKDKVQNGKSLKDPENTFN